MDLGDRRLCFLHVSIIYRLSTHCYKFSLYVGASDEALEAHQIQQISIKAISYLSEGGELQEKLLNYYIAFSNYACIVAYICALMKLFVERRRLMRIQAEVRR